jgi:hypothetical protein
MSERVLRLRKKFATLDPAKKRRQTLPSDKRKLGIANQREKWLGQSEHRSSIGMKNERLENEKPVKLECGSTQMDGSNSGVVAKREWSESGDARLEVISLSESREDTSDG